MAFFQYGFWKMEHRMVYDQKYPIFYNKNSKIANNQDARETLEKFMLTRRNAYCEEMCRVLRKKCPGFVEKFVSFNDKSESQYFRLLLDIDHEGYDTRQTHRQSLMTNILTFDFPLDEQGLYELNQVLTAIGNCTHEQFYNCFAVCHYNEKEGVRKDHKKHKENCKEKSQNAREQFVQKMQQLKSQERKTRLDELQISDWEFIADFPKAFEFDVTYENSFPSSVGLVPYWNDRKFFQDYLKQKEQSGIIKDFKAKCCVAHQTSKV